jgi:hypothetical protein
MWRVLVLTAFFTLSPALSPANFLESFIDPPYRAQAQTQPQPLDVEQPQPRIGGSVPQPDPTRLTTDQLRREIAALRELIEARINGRDEAVRLLQEATDKQPQRTREAVEQLKAVLDEKFAGVETKFEGIATQFTERDVRSENDKATTKVAVDAALQAAEKAVGAALVNSSQVTNKSEENFTKQIDGIGTLIASQNKSTDDQFDDMKARLQAIESRNEGQTIQKADTSQTWVLAFGGVGMVLAIVMAMLALMRPIMSRGAKE